MTAQLETESSAALREALARIVYETTKPNGVITNDWYYETVLVVHGIAKRALDED